MTLTFNPLKDPCLSCGLWQGKKNPCIRPKEVMDALVQGGARPGNCSAVFVGEGPGEEEDEQGEAFVGKAGQILRRILASIGDFGWFAFLNAVRCRPTNRLAQNRAPSVQEVAYCSSYLEADIAYLQPQKIIALGAVAARSLGCPSERLQDLRRRRFSYEIQNDVNAVWGGVYSLDNLHDPPVGIPVYVTYHPAAGLRPGKVNLIKELEDDLRLYLLSEKATAKGQQVPENRALTNPEEHGILNLGGVGEDTIVVDIETSGFLKGGKEFPFDKKGTILNIGTDKGQVAGDLGEPWHSS